LVQQNRQSLAKYRFCRRLIWVQSLH